MNKTLLATILLASLAPACAFHGIARAPVSTVSLRPVVMHGAGTSVVTAPNGGHIGMSVNTPGASVGMSMNASPNGASVSMSAPGTHVSVGASTNGASVGAVTPDGHAVSAGVTVSP